MNVKQAREIVKKYRQELEELKAHPCEGPFDCQPDGDEVLDHAASMLDRMDDMLNVVIMDDERCVDFTDTLEKFQRWLGFMQGVFWVEGVFTLDEMRDHNRV